MANRLKHSSIHGEDLEISREQVPERDYRLEHDGGLCCQVKLTFVTPFNLCLINKRVSSKFSRLNYIVV